MQFLGRFSNLNSVPRPLFFLLFYIHHLAKLPTLTLNLLCKLGSLELVILLPQPEKVADYKLASPWKAKFVWPKGPYIMEMPQKESTELWCGVERKQDAVHSCGCWTEIGEGQCRGAAAW